MLRLLAALVPLLFATSAFAADAVCPELSAIQRWAGYLSLRGLFYAASALLVGGGFCFFFWGFIEWIGEFIWELIKDVADVFVYVAGVGLIIYANWLPEADQLWPVLVGCVLFGAAVQFSIWLREIKGDDPTLVFLIYMAVWGPVAVYYHLPEVGFLAVAALMGVLGFSVAVTPLCYAFGFRSRERVADATASALLLLTVYCVERVFFPGAIPAVKVFEPGVFWLGSFVGFTGLLILSDRWYLGRKNPNYGWIQVVTVVFYLLGLAVGMIFGINALAGMAGTFMVLYLADKIVGIEVDGAMGFGFKLMVVGGLFWGAWKVSGQYEGLIQTYLTTTLPM